MAIRLGSDCNGLVTGRSLANLGERQLFDSPTGRKQHEADLKRLLMEAIRMRYSIRSDFGRSRPSAVVQIMESNDSRSA